MITIHIKENLLYINEKIDQALKNSGRDTDVKLIAVTKTVDLISIEDAISYGIKNIGENRVQELVPKMENLKDKVQYHMIGYLQSNKVKYIIDNIDLIHSLDRISLAKELEKRAKQRDITVDTLIQVNVAEEESKSGLKLEEVVPFIEKILGYENINIKGLMTIAPYTDDRKLLRQIFRTMENLRQDIISRKYKNVSMEYLSMGMTNDFDIAIEEGSNMIRVGTGIFGKRNY